MPDSFDVLVLGAGPGGYVAAIRAAQLGLKVACVEKSPSLGGTCLNIGCIPSKALLDSSELYYLAKHRFERHGIRVGDVTLDLPRLLARKNAVVDELTKGVAFLLKKNQITLVTGTGRLSGRGVVDVRDSAGKQIQLQAKHIILATGSEPSHPPALPFDGQHIVSSTEALCFERVPEHLLVVGAGFIGLELGSVWARLGARVTVLEFLPRILPSSDTELATLLQRALVKQGLTFHLETKVTGATVQAGKVKVQAEAQGKPLSFEGERVLVATGRKPCIGGLGLQEAGVALSEGRIKIDAHFQTTVPGVYAIGDLVAGPMLAHKASEEGIALAEQLAGKAGHVNYDAIPGVIYTAPELASVGLTEEQLQARGVKYKVGRFPFKASGRAKCLDETEGLVKVLTDARTDRLLGMHILGPRASDLIAEAVLALEFGASAEDIARTCHGHPTLGEAVGEAARAAWDKMIQG